MDLATNRRTLWEFEILAFLREEFPNVGIAMPHLRNNPKLWRMIYLVVQGVHEIARFHDDLVDMRLDVNEEKDLEFSFFTFRGDLNSDYYEILHMVADHKLEELYDKTCQYCPPNLQPDHEANLLYIDDVVMQGQKLMLEQQNKLPPKQDPNEFLKSSASLKSETDEINFGRMSPHTGDK